ERFNLLVETLIFALIIDHCESCSLGSLILNKDQKSFKEFIVQDLSLPKFSNNGELLLFIG
ncbi:MAG: hypothetical protein RLZZ490_507, partial [Cyanobacteriota bacterium]